MDPGRIDELDTPFLTVDLDVFEYNVRLCINSLDGVRVRPHLKTAKSPEVAQLLLSAGASGVCVAKLGEAEVMLAGGLDDVLITTELVGAIKVRRLAQLMSRWPDARVRVVVDSWEGASVIDAALPGDLETLIARPERPTEALRRFRCSNSPRRSGISAAPGTRSTW
jgi:D-serine deaminase-like pyridoxal phosphate-dependent protein